MNEPRGSSELTRDAILREARELFATRGISDVTVRQIAAEAGVTHALVHRYFGTKEAILAEILRRELQTASALPVSPDPGTVDPIELVRRMLVYGLTDARMALLLITRAELAGLEPEKMLDHEQFRPIGLMAEWLARQQAGVSGDAGAESETGAGGAGDEPGANDAAAGLPDPALVSAVVGGAVFAFQSLGPWLMAAVGLKPEDVVARREEILDILMGIVTRAAVRS